MGNCAILGAGGHAKVAMAALRGAGWTVEAVFDDEPSCQGALLQGVPIRGGAEEAFSARLPLHLAIGSNKARSRIASRVSPQGWARAIHPGAQIDPSATVGEGSLVCMGALVQVDARIGRHAIVNTGAIVEHDCVLGDFVHLAPGAKLAGGVEVGEGAMIGLGAHVLPGVRIGAWSIIGAGAVVIRPVSEGETVAGCPARTLR